MVLRSSLFVALVCPLDSTNPMEHNSLLQARTLMQSLQTDNLNVLQMQSMKDNFANIAQSTSVEEDMKLLAKFVKENVTALQKNRTVDRHAVLNAELVAELGTFTNCTDGFTSAKAEDTDAFHGNTGSVVTSRAQHATCRAELSTLDTAKNEACADLHKFISSVPTPSSCTVPSRDDGKAYFENLQTYVYQYQSTWQSKDDLCKSFEDNTTKKLAECKTNQEAFEDDFCEWRLQTYATCAEQASCYAGAVESFGKRKLASQEEEVELKSEFSLAVTIECLIDVLVSDEDMDTRQTNAASCKNNEVDTSHLTLTIPEIPAHELCDYSAVRNPPCEGTFIATEYSGMSFVEECTPCDKLPTLVHNMPEVNKYSNPYQILGCPFVGAGHWHVGGFDTEGKWRCAGHAGTDCFGPVASVTLDTIRQMAVGSDTTWFLRKDRKTVTGFGSEAHSNTFEHEITALLPTSAGYCVRFEDKKLQCVGSNSQNAMTNIQAAFDGKDWKKWISGRYYACIIKLDDTMECAGTNDGNYIVPVPKDVKVLQADCGASACCWVKESDGALECASAMPWNDYPEDTPKITYPNSIAVSYHTMIALKGDQQWLWGYGDRNGYTVDRELPAEIAGNPHAFLMDFSSDGLQRCAIVPEGMEMKLKCWYSHKDHSQAGSSITDNDLYLSYSQEQCNTVWQFPE